MSELPKHKHSVSASNMRNRTARDDIAGLVRAFSRDIDTRIQSANEAGLDNTTFELPLDLQVANIQSNDALLILYTDIIKFYSDPEPEGRGFNITLDKNKLIIKWAQSITQEEREYRRSILNQARKQPIVLPRVKR